MSSAGADETEAVAECEASIAVEDEDDDSMMMPTKIYFIILVSSAGAHETEAAAECETSIAVDLQILLKLIDLFNTSDEEFLELR